MTIVTPAVVNTPCKLVQAPGAFQPGLIQHTELLPSLTTGLRVIRLANGGAPRRRRRQIQRRDRDEGICQ